MYNNIPEWLTHPEYTIFCTHKNKIPNARVDDMSTFQSFQAAFLSLKDGEGLGIGLFGNLCGIDIDHAVQADGTLSPTAQDIINYFDGAYMEYSYSGTGVHILFFCAQQKKYQKYYVKMGEKQLQAKGITDIGGLELYQGRIDNRYLTLTGNIIPQSKTNNYTVSPDKLTAFLDKYFKRPTLTQSSTPVVCNDEEDQAWWNWAKTRRPERLFQLASQIPTGSGGTESEDDLALCQELSFWCNKNQSLVRQAFESSYYYKHKDDKHKTKWARPAYSNTTIEKAISTGSTAKEFFKDSFQYDPNTKAIIPIKVEGGDAMIAPKYSTRVSQKGDTIHILETKRFKFEVSPTKQKKDSQEKYVSWVSVYEKGSDKPTSFLDRKDPAFELAAGIVLDKEEV